MRSTSSGVLLLPFPVSCSLSSAGGNDQCTALMLMFQSHIVDTTPLSVFGLAIDLSYLFLTATRSNHHGKTLSQLPQGLGYDVQIGTEHRILKEIQGERAF